MSETNETIRHDAPTRRDTIKYGGTIAAGAVLAGCTGGGEGDATGDTSESTASETETPAADTSYEVCIEPVGCQTFETVPETYLTYNGAWADMAFALGQRGGLRTSRVMPPSYFYEPFGLDVPPASNLPGLWDGGWDKEVFYELDPDVILIDPKYLESSDSWDASDTEEIATNVAPFFGNNARRRREFHDYRLYTLYECFEKLADLFQQRERYEAFVDVHEKLQTEIQSRLPSENQRPSIGLINGASDPNKGEFYPLNTQDEGYEMKPYRDLGVPSAFSQEMEAAGSIDYERLLDVDPEIILVHWGIGTTSDNADSFAAEAFREQYVTPMEEHDVGQELTAVQNGDIYPGQYGEQGPIANLLQTEMVAQQLYPEEFGAFDPEAFPEIPDDRQLFDRQRVADIINGDI